MSNSQLSALRLLGVRLVQGITLVLVLSASSARASEGCKRRGDTLGWYVPDHARLQTGGYLGLVTLGAGYSAFDLLDVDLYYGWVPEAVGGTSLHTPALRIGAHAEGLCLTPDLRWIYVQGGVGAVLAFGDGFFIVTPDRYPSGYYPITALRGFVSVSMALELRQPDGSPIASHGVFVELSALDQYLISWLKSTGSIGFWEPWSLAFGYKAGL